MAFSDISDADLSDLSDNDIDGGFVEALRSVTQLAKQAEGIFPLSPLDFEPDQLLDAATVLASTSSVKSNFPLLTHPREDRLTLTFTL